MNVLTFAININQVVLVDPQKICHTSDNFYKKSSRYLGYYTDKLIEYFTKNKYRVLYTEYGTNRGRYVLVSDEISGTIKIEQFLFEDSKVPSELRVIFEDELLLTGIAALFGNLKTPKAAIALG